MLTQKPKRHRFPIEIISYALWSYHRFNDSFRDVKERLLYRGITVSHEAIRGWCLKFGGHFSEVIKKRAYKPGDKWHLDEMMVKLNGEFYYLWRAVDAQGHELDIFLQKRRNKRSAIRFLMRLLGHYSKPRVIVTDKLNSYVKPIKQLCKGTEHRRHKGLNNRAENAHQPTRRKEKCLIKFKSPRQVQQVLTLMGRTRNIFAIAVGRYTHSAVLQRTRFQEAKTLWQSAANELLCA